MSIVYHFARGKTIHGRNKKQKENRDSFRQENEIMFEIGIVPYLKMWYNIL